MSNYFMKPMFAVFFVFLFANAKSHSQDLPSVVTPSPLTVEIRFGTGIENKKLVGESDSFSKDIQQIIGWTHIKGAKEPTEIQHIWKWNEKAMGTVSLIVQSSSFRTFSRKTVYGKTGTWTLEVKDMDGQLLGSKQFEIIASANQ